MQYEGKGASKKKLEVHFWILKNPNFPCLSWIRKNLEAYTVQDQHFKIKIFNLWMNSEYLYLNFTVENKMGNSHKKDGHLLNLT